MANNVKFTKFINSDGTKQAVALDKVKFDEQTKKLTLYSSTDESIKEETIIPASDIEVDNSLSREGKAADAASTGDAIKDIVKIGNNISDFTSIIVSNESDEIELVEQGVFDAEIAKFNAKVGTPLMAKYANEMTDVSKIYVYTGNEVGYVGGNWYFYNGITWTDGGVYNSVAIETDKTLTVENMAADAKVTGDEIADLKSGLTSAEEQIYADLDDFTSVEESVNFFSGFTQDGRLDNSTGEELTGDYKRSDYIPLDPTQSKIYVLRQSYGFGLRLFYYAEDKTFISQDQIFASSVTFLSGVRDIPENAKYIRTYKATSTTSWIEFSYTEQTTYTPYWKKRVLSNQTVHETTLDTALQVKVNKKTNTGQVIVCLGDSVFGKRRDDKSIPSVIADITGATVYNCAFGGTKASSHHRGYSSDTYWTQFDFLALSSAIASGTWTAQDNALASYSDFPDYFSDALATLKSIDFSDVDIITINYGGNDYTSGDYIDDENNPYSNVTYLGALRTGIETILTAFPNLRILMVSPPFKFFIVDGAYSTDGDIATYNDAHETLQDFALSLEKIKLKYHVPLCNLYDELSINKYNRDIWFSSNDGSHPSIKGCEMTAKLVSTYLARM